MKYSLGQREQLYIMVLRLCSGEAGHHSHEYFNIVNKGEHTLSEVLGKQPFFSLPPALGDEEPCLGISGGLRSPQADGETKPLVSAF